MPNDKIKKQLSDEDLLNAIGPDDDAPDDTPKQKRAPLKKLKKWFHNLTKKQKVALIAISLLVIVAIALGLFFIFKGDKKIALPVVKKTETKKVVKPTTEPGRLTGVAITPELNRCWYHD